MTARPVLVALLAGILGIGGASCSPPPATIDVSVKRTSTEVMFAASTWATAGAQVFLCPRSIALVSDLTEIEGRADAAGCIDLGIGPADHGIKGIGLPFDSLSPADRTAFSAAPSWSVIIVENPAPLNRALLAVQQEIAGGPIEP